MENTLMAYSWPFFIEFKRGLHTFLMMLIGFLRKMVASSLPMDLM